MASPVAHSLLGLTVGRFGEERRIAAGRPWGWYLFAVVAANAADLDFLAGLLVGDVNGFHRSVSHSLAASLAFGLVVAVVARLRRRPALRPAAWATLLYASHLGLDALSGEAGIRTGQPLLWPFRGDEVSWPWPVFPSVDHGTAGATLDRFLDLLFSRSNLEVILVETALLAPVTLLAIWWTRARAGPRSRLRLEAGHPGRSPDGR